MLSLAMQFSNKGWQQLSGLWTHKKARWVYQEPHWVLVVQLALVVFCWCFREAVDRRLALRMVPAWRRLQVWRAKALARIRAVKATVQARLARVSNEAGDVERHQLVTVPVEPAAGSPDVVGSASAPPDGQQSEEPLVVRGEGPVVPLEPEAVVDSSKGSGGARIARDAQEFESWFRLLAAAEAPILICMVVSVACHIVVAALQALQLSTNSGMMATAISRIWVFQLINYTLSAWWLAVRLLNQHLAQSTSRPNVSGDLSNLEESVPAISRRFAHEASMVQLAKAAFSVIAFLTCLKHLGYNISRLLAVTSLSGVAFSFLLGDLLANVFASFVLYLTQPFAQGDWVQSPDGKVDGWIQTVGWYYTTVMRWEKRPHYIPNSTFGFMPLVNCSRMTHRRILIEGRLRMRDLDKIEEILKDVRSIVENHNDIDKTMHRLCRLKEIDDFFVTLWVSCYVPNITLAKYLQVQESILLGICSTLRKHGTNWASSLERFHTAPGQPGDNAELTNEFRRLLNARSTLLAHERDLEERQAALAEGQLAIDELQEKVEQLQMEKMSKASNFERHSELSHSRSQSLGKRKHALQTKRSAMVRRSQAMLKLEQSLQKFKSTPRLAADMHQEALDMREESIAMAWQAVLMERGAIQSEKDALEYEKALLERKREPGGSSGAADFLGDASPAAGEEIAAGASDGLAGGRSSAGGGASPLALGNRAAVAAVMAPTSAVASAAADGGASQEVAAEGAASSGQAPRGSEDVEATAESDLADVREQAAVAIGGE